MATNAHARLDSLERAASKTSALLAHPPPLLIVGYQDAVEGQPVGEPVQAYTGDPLAPLKARLKARFSTSAAQ